MSFKSFLEKRQYLLHLSVWLILITIGTSVVPPAIPLTYALPFIGFRIGVMATVVYLNVFFIIPRFFRKGKFVGYFLIICLLITMVVMLNGWVEQSLEPAILQKLNIDRASLAPENSPFKGRPPIYLRSVVSVFITIAFLFVSTVIKLGADFLEKERLEANLQNEKLQAELKFLRSQINPHFLFNALNNLYAINQLDPKKAQDYILKLSEMLRYVIYECSKDRVSVSQEIKYIQNYLFFQQNKGAENQEISFEVSGKNPDTFFVEPMILVPFVENCFKHNYASSSEDRFVRLHLSLRDGQLHFSAENNLSEKSLDPLGEDGTIGIGIQNVRRRLELLYEDAFTLDFEDSGESFKVLLTLEKYVTHPRCRWHPSPPKRGIH